MKASVGARQNRGQRDRVTVLASASRSVELIASYCIPVVAVTNEPATGI